MALVRAKIDVFIRADQVIAACPCAQGVPASGVGVVLDRRDIQPVAAMQIFGEKHDILAVTGIHSLIFQRGSRSVTGDLSRTAMA